MTNYNDADWAFDNYHNFCCQRCDQFVIPGGLTDVGGIKLCDNCVAADRQEQA